MWINDKKYSLKAEITVEMSIVFPIVLISLITIISTSIYMYKQVENAAIQYQKTVEEISCDGADYILKYKVIIDGIKEIASK